MMKTILEAWNKVVMFTDNLHSAVDKTSHRLNGFWNELIEKLREEDNVHLRYATVVTGGIVGGILARRGGKFKKTLYGSLGALSASAVCYPEKAKTTFKFVRHNVIVAYHLINGYSLDEYYEKKRMKEMGIDYDDMAITDVELNNLAQKLNKDSYFEECINSVASKEVLNKRKNIGIIYEKKTVSRDAKNQ
ncbi:uncharacterized protein LOC126844668 [Adelges cooleyi]|uniref:uncharacterized protein LOC126844668 n=1 Tax=Adelges cooleyi TaxID=133065 RepID=UPI00217F40E7|nr:uncharacterized protein LOC126844668 [Adelges cooleyi]